MNRRKFLRNIGEELLIRLYGFKISKDFLSVFKKDKQNEKKYEEKKVSYREMQWKKVSRILHIVIKILCGIYVGKIAKNYSSINCSSV